MSNFCKTIVDYSGSNGAMPLLYSIRDCVPFAFPGLLFTIFLILFGSQYFLIKNKTGRAKVLIALLSSSFFMVTLSLFLSLAELINYLTVIFYAFITIISFVLLYLSDKS